MTDTTADVWAALIAAQNDMPPLTKTATADTGKFSYSYAPLPDVLACARAALGGHGLAVSQDVTVDGVTTIIAHTTGQTLRFGPLPTPIGGGPQQTGSAITYMRRYGVMAALGLAAEDDDAQSWTPPAPRPAPAPEPPPAPPAPSTNVLASRWAKLDDVGQSEVAESVNQKLGTALAVGTPPADMADQLDAAGITEPQRRGLATLIDEATP